MNYTYGPLVIEFEEAVKIYFPSEKNRRKTFLYIALLLLMVSIHIHYIGTYKRELEFGQYSIPALSGLLLVTGYTIGFLIFNILYQLTGYEELIMKNDETLLRKGFGSIFYIQFPIKAAHVSKDVGSRDFPFALETGGCFNATGEGRLYIPIQSGRRRIIGGRMEFNQARDIVSRIGKYRNRKLAAQRRQYTVSL